MHTYLVRILILHGMVFSNFLILFKKTVTPKTLKVNPTDSTNNTIFYKNPLLCLKT